MSDVPSDPDAREKWWRISAIFAVASQLPPAERDAMLPSLCASHPDDLDEIKALLAQHDAGSTFLDRPDPLGVRPGGTDVFAPDEQVGHYRVRSRLSTGGMGVLYLAEDNLRRLVVLKVLVPALAADPAQRQRLRHEAEAMARLKHPGIATVYAFDESKSVPFLVTEYVAGRNLRERLQSDGPYDPMELVDLAIEITDALCAAHAENIVHRDLKPENVMLPQAGGVKLIDFGIARFSDLETRMTQSGTVVGTLAYMSPEQIEGSRVDHRSDLFSLGVVLYEAATNSNPFVGHTKETTLTNILRLNPPPLSTRRPLTFGRMESIVARCLCKAPSARYQSAQDLLADLRVARADAPSPLHVPRPAVGETAAVWWWVLHQMAVSVVQGLLLVPLWFVRTAIEWTDGRLLAFFVPLALAAVSIVTRFHSAFIARNWRHSLERLRRRIAKRHAVVRVADTLFAISTATVALVVIRAKPGLAALLLSFALGLLTTLYIVEPVTMQDAFEDDEAEDKSLISSSR